MKKTTLIALAAALVAIAEELQGDCTATAEAPETPTGDAPADPPQKRRGRGPAAAEKAAEPVLTGKTYEDMHALIKPLVEAARGAEVKAVIAKYATSLKEMDAKHYAAFERDIEALTL